MPERCLWAERPWEDFYAGGWNTVLEDGGVYKLWYEASTLLDFLYQHCIRPEFTCRFRWSEGALAIWDNRCTLHYAINDYDGQRRLLHRTAIAGERPIAG